MLTRSIRVSRRLHASPVRVFAAWLDPSIARRWLFATASQPIAQVELDARPGGSFLFVDRGRHATVEYRGEYLLVDPPRRLGFSLVLDGPSPAITHVIVEIEGAPGGCTLELVHEHLPKERAPGVEGRWCGMLYGLAEWLDANPAARERPLRRPVPFSNPPAYRSAP